MSFTHDKNQVRVGESRPSQLLYMYGIGSLIDLPKMSVLVMGLEDWKHREYCRHISEDRLLRAVQNRLGPQVEKLQAPPRPSPEESLMMDQFQQNRIGVPVAPFPRWLRCPSCNLLAPIHSELVQFKRNPYRAEENRYVHINCFRSKGNYQPTMLPVRFLVACENGHLDDFPWRMFVHRGPTDCNGRLEMREFGASGEPSALEVRCTAKECEKKRRMSDALGGKQDKSLPRCRGRHPHLRMFESQPCDASLRTILLASTNSWFSDTLTVLSVPTSSDPLAQLVESRWAELSIVTDKAILGFLRATDKLGPLTEYSDADIFQAIQARQGEAEDDDDFDPHDLKLPEWEVLSQPETAKRSDDFQLREVDPPEAYSDVIDKVVLVERLRAVTALLGFTRIRSPRDFLDDEGVMRVRRAPLSRKAPTMIPASEVKGEGIFLSFREEAIRAWQQRAQVEYRERDFHSAHVIWRQARMLPGEEGFPGIRYVLIHSFAHALMRQFSLSCGYNAASICERIYARDPEEEGGPMAGLLIYTAAPDSEGTLGGLVSLGETKRLGGYIHQALEEIRLCASDPLCAEHHPKQDDNNVTLHGAACHACLFAPETSCEKGNRFLDRSLLINTVNSSDMAQYLSFFQAKE